LMLASSFNSQQLAAMVEQRPSQLPALSGTEKDRPESLLDSGA
jgi:hypothetical protein